MQPNTWKYFLFRKITFPENRYFPEMLFSGKENIFMCLVAFQKIFRKIFSDVWLCSWKYHRKYIFYLLLTFSRLPNEFIPQITNKAQKKIIKSGQTKGEIAISIGAIAIGEIAISELCAITIGASRDHDGRRSARCLDRSLSLSLRTISLSRCIWSCVSGVLAKCVSLTATEIVWR